MLNPDLFNESLKDWDRCETDTGLLYYVNHKTEVTQWDHPLLVKVINDLGEMDMIKYAAYRTAIKLRLLQKHLRLDLVDTHLIGCAFERRGYGCHDDNDDNTHIDNTSLHSLLDELFAMSQNRSLSPAASQLNPLVRAELLLNLLLNLYDRKRRGYVRISAVHVALAMLSSTRLTDKYRYFFRIFCDSGNHMSRDSMFRFLHDIVKFPEMLHESSAFGGINIGPAVEHCFSLSWNANGVTEDEFVNWLLREPQTIVWLPTMHRVTAAETVKHESKCNSCKMYPIVGIRYRCLRCFNYDLCQDCFFVGRVSKKHKAHHPIQEYCIASSVKEDTKAMLRTVRYNLSKKRRRNKKLRYVPIYSGQQPYPQHFSDDDQEPLVESCPMKAMNVSQLDTSASCKPSKCLQTESCPQDNVPSDEVERYEMQAAMYQLEEENRQLLSELEHVHSHTYVSHRSTPTGSVSDASITEAAWLADENERLLAEQSTLRAQNSRLQQRLSQVEKCLQEWPPVGSSNEQSTSPPVHKPSADSNLQTFCTPIEQTRRPPWPRPADQSSMTEDQSAMTTEYPAADITQKSATPGEVSNVSPVALRTQFIMPDSDSGGELDDLVARLDQIYPNDATHSALDDTENATRGEMLRAAGQIGTAFSQFVTNVGQTNELAQNDHLEGAVSSAEPIQKNNECGGYISDH